MMQTLVVIAWLVGIVAALAAVGSPSRDIGLGVRWAGAVTAAIVFVVVANGAPILLVAFGWVVRDIRRRRLERSEAARIRAFVPEVADLCSIGLSAGLSIRSAVRHVADIGDNPVCDALGEAVRLSDRGVAFSDALNTSSEGVHQAVGSLFGMLAVAERSGASASAILQRFADHERELQRRSAQESLRKLPVKLLPPIITCVLPAFVLTTVVPIAVAVIGSMSLPEISP